MAHPGTILIFGAGCIGRGLLGELAAHAGRHMVFVETQPELAIRLSEAGKYTVRLTGRNESSTRVADYDVLTPEDAAWISKAVRSCDFAATAVGGAQLHDVARLMAPGLTRRGTPLDILICENWPHADKVLSAALFRCGLRQDGYACAPCSVERMVRQDSHSLDLVGESCESVHVDFSGWQGAMPDMAGLIASSDLASLYARKLFTNNAGHALLAYEGHLAGHHFIYEAVQDPSIHSLLTAFLEPATKLLSVEYAMDHERLKEHVAILMQHRFANRDLADTIERVAKNPLRKLGAEERLVGLLRQLQKHELPVEPVCRTIAAALCYERPDDEESRRMAASIRKDGPGRVLRDVCGMRSNEACFQLCLEEWDVRMRTNHGHALGRSDAPGRAETGKVCCVSETVPRAGRA